uniref:Uncharacterized protein n=1 Tax=Arundo donax TaxID=35708 RepID=A0A0A9BB34_ARUDO
MPLVLLLLTRSLTLLTNTSEKNGDSSALEYGENLQEIPFLVYNHQSIQCPENI